MKKLIFLSICAFLMTAQVNGQVKFKIEKMLDQPVYTVSFVPEQSWDAPFNITSTAQITIKASSGTLVPTHITSLQEGAFWELNSRIESPEEASDYDYFSFALTSLGTSAFEFAEGQALPVLQFENANGCMGTVQLVDNDSDIFMPPNSRKLNIGNQISVLGAKGEAYTGLVDDGTVDCLVSSTSELTATDFEIHPNPAVEFILIDYQLDIPSQEAQFVITDAEGHVVQQARVNLLSGQHQMRIELSSLPGGVYFPEFRGTDWQLSLDRLMIKTP